MRLVLDNIVFSLQKGGGVSVVWSEHLKRLLSQQEFLLSFIEYDNAQKNFLRHVLSLETVQKKHDFLLLKRYVNPRLQIPEPYIFHSSYYRVSRDTTARNVTTVHDFTYEHYTKGIAKCVHSWQKKRAILRSQKIICISENTKRDLLRFIPKVSSDKIHVIHNGVSEDFYPIPSAINNETLHPFEKLGYLLFVGSRIGYKNFSMAIEAARLVKLPLVIVGGGNLSNIEKEELEKKLGCNYFYLGFVDSRQLNVLYNNAFCLLYPSDYEGFGIPVIEAQKAGCPVIANYNSSIPEIIGDTKIKLVKINANIIAESIQMLTSSTREYEIQQGLTNAKRFSWDITFEKTMQLYKLLEG